MLFQEKEKKDNHTEKYTLLKAIYVVFLGLIIALFVGLGIAAFYTAPVVPKMPPEAVEVTYRKDPSPEAIKAQREYEKQQQNYNENQLAPYNRNVSIISLIFAVVILTLGMVFSLKFLILSDGILLGGVFTLIYSIINAVGANNVRFTFVIVSIGLVVTIFLGYWKFLRHQKG